MKKISLSILVMGAAYSGFAQTNKYATEQQNMNNFHLVDFVGWNTNMDVLAHSIPQMSKFLAMDGKQQV